MPSGNKKYIVVAIDHFTQWIEVAILTHETSQSIMNFIEWEILMRRGCPKRIQTDGGKLNSWQESIASLTSSILCMRSQHLTILRVIEGLKDL